MFWTTLHAYTLIPEFIVFAIGAFLLSRVLKDKDFETRMLPLKICTAALLLLEVAKQIMGVVTGYDKYWIPLHFCSLFLYVHPLACFYKGKHREKFLMLAGVVSTCLFLFMAVYPNVIYSDDAIRSMWSYVTGRGGSFFELHTVLFHVIGTVTFFLFLFQGLIKFRVKRDVPLVILMYGL
ncbi:MAG: YwaF family protein [Lachnospiraceae bacterium]|nr:YwaF family protein [Lachnospiraceae bacterium]